MYTNVSTSIQSFLELSFDPVFLITQAGTIVERNEAAVECFPVDAYPTLREIVGDESVWQPVLQECVDQKQAVELSPVKLIVSDDMEVNSSIRAAMVEGEEASLFLLSISLGQSGLDAIRNYAQLNDERVEKLSHQLTVMGTELLEKTNLLMEERNKILTIIHNMGDGLIACDREGVVIHCNDTAEELLHLPEQKIGAAFVDVCASVALAVKLNPQQPEIKHPVELNIPFKQKELRVHASPVFDDEKHYAGFVFIIQDRTKQAEVDRMKTELISIVSHELRSPLTSIKGYVDLMQSGDFGAVPEEMTGYLDVIADNANRLSALIEDMLDLSRIESGKLSMNFGRVDIQYLCDSVYLTLKPLAEQKKQTLERRVEEGLCVSGDVERLQQAVTNLVANAVKYTPDEGNVSFEAVRHDGEVWITVTDTGYGIPAGQQPKLFQKFFRAKSRKTQHIGGTGLGLCITKSIAELHEGSVGFESVEDKGSTFTLKLPAYQD